MNENNKLEEAQNLNIDGTKHFDEGNWSEALTRYIGIISCLAKDFQWKTREKEKTDLLLKGYLNISACLLQMEEFDKVFIYCNEALILDTDNEEALCGRAVANEKLRNLRDALNDFETVLKVNPRNEVARTKFNEIKENFQEEKVTRKAIQTLEEVEDYKSIYLQKGIQLIEKGQRGAAINLIKEMKVLTPPKYRHLWNGTIKTLEIYDADFITAWGVEEANKKEFGFDYCFFKAKKLKEDGSTMFKEFRQVFKDLDSERMEDILRKAELLDNMDPVMRNTIEQERYFKILHSTLAIEENEFTLDNIKYYLQTKQQIKGRSKVEHDEVDECAFVIAQLNRSMPTSFQEIDKAFLLNIHRMALNKSQPLHAGQIRHQDIFIGSYEAPEPGKVEQHLDLFVIWLKVLAPMFHPIETAIRAHFMLTHIHPFADGNGRTCRLLMNIILRMSGFPSVEIPVERKMDYSSSLHMAHNDYLDPFRRFILECIQCTLNDYFP